ncbi:MAG: hypothetical protein ABI743_05495 [bacterium]
MIHDPDAVQPDFDALLDDSPDWDGWMADRQSDKRSRQFAIAASLVLFVGVLIMRVAEGSRASEGIATILVVTALGLLLISLSLRRLNACPVCSKGMMGGWDQNYCPRCGIQVPDKS